MPSRRRFNTDSKYATADDEFDLDDTFDTHSASDGDDGPVDDADADDDGADGELLLKARHAARIRGRRRLLPGAPSVGATAVNGSAAGVTLPPTGKFAEFGKTNGSNGGPPFGPRENFRRTKSCSASNGGGGPSSLNDKGMHVIHGQEDRRFKNYRKSRSLFGRGLVKKGGAGGKGVWGAPGSELAVTGDDAVVKPKKLLRHMSSGSNRSNGYKNKNMQQRHDADDANYDSSELEDYADVVLVSRQTTRQEIIEQIGIVTREYFQHGDTNEFILTLMDWCAKDNAVPAKLRQLIPYAIVRTALDGKRCECEMASQLLADMPDELVTRDKIEEGFTRLLEELIDLQLDCPEAPQIVGNFLARAVADEVVSLSYVRRLKRTLQLQRDAVLDEIVAAAAGDDVDGEDEHLIMPKKSLGATNLHAANEKALMNGHGPSLANGGHAAKVNGYSTNARGKAPPSHADSGRGISISSATTVDHHHGVGEDFMADGEIDDEERANLSAVAHEALQRADTLLSMKHGMIKLDTIWGIGGGVTPVRALSTKMSQIIKEYIKSAELDEALRCIRELDVPHFHHELIFLIIQHACEANGRYSDRLLRLLKALSATDTMIVPTAQMARGFQRAFEAMNDMLLDVPQVYSIVEEIVNESVKLGVIDEQVAQACPQRGRKRFVSEGDGGLLKV